MNRKNWRENWYVLFVLLLFILQMIMMTAWGEHSFVAIHDNLDLFVAHNTLLRNLGLFFGSVDTVPMLGGVSRDVLGNEFALYNLPYAIFPSYFAYVFVYLLKILIGFGGSVWLARIVLGEEYGKLRGLVWLVAAGFSLIPVFPNYGIAFTSIPLFIGIVKQIDEQGKGRWYLLLFFYPLLSYFSYFGFFLLGYLVCGIFFLWIIRKKFPHKLTGALFVLAGGYVLWERRLFRHILFDDTVTIRSSMVYDHASFSAVVDKVLEGLVNPVFHAQDSHAYWILWVCLVVMLAVNWERVRQGGKKKVYQEPINLVFSLILFNSLIYGLYDYKPFRDFCETLLPQLKGFQFNRTIFLNPFLWYLLFFLCLVRVAKGINRREIGKKVAYLSAVVGVLVCMFVPQVYNDFYQNCYHHAYELIKGEKSTQLSFREFYAKELFTRIKETLSYQGEWSAAYGIHPAILQYNGISTLDGYLGIYGQEYKARFREVIAPALNRSAEFRTYYDSWGARAYLYSGSGENTYHPLRNLEVADRNLAINKEAFKKLGGKYIFSRIEIQNAEELQLSLRGEFQTEDSAYRLYVYQVE